MHDDLDIHEPEHDHLLDHEFDEGYELAEDEVNPLFDDSDDEEEYGLDVLDDEDHDDHDDD
ncbi:hypothetical protein [Pseudomonas fontis]|uniref:Uncharacterized protein n=1 Tax=Pseudomonas fontis TaxID=2942633 RepID=A0ABT5NMH9_9PSED|nr:hypothetical protein [Pseudomonas fontis]MDD0976188.1 hypothetical protein [Pseudomonas fontis]MDD0989049.1 hypothetical protein [Pseudomonas fontis]